MLCDRTEYNIGIATVDRRRGNKKTMKILKFLFVAKRRIW